MDYNAIVAHLKDRGWTVEQQSGPWGPIWEWRGPDGVSGLDFRADSADEIPPGVFRAAVARGDLVVGAGC